jgi:hypothetical protein
MNYKNFLGFLVLLALGLSACQNSSPTNTSGDQPTPTPTPSPVSTPDIVISRSVVGVTATPDYGGSVTYSLSICNDSVSISSPTSIIDSFSGTDFQMVCWGWNGIIPYSHPSGLDATHPFTDVGQSGGNFTFYSVPSGCATIFAVYQNPNWASDTCQSFVHSSFAYISGSGAISFIAAPETILAPCPSATLSPTPTFTPTETETPLYSYTPTETFTPTGTPTDTPTATDTFTPCPNATQVGDMVPGASAVTLTLFNTYAQQYDVPQPGTLKKIWLQPDRVAFARLGIYSNSSGGNWPQDLIYASGSVTLSSGLNAVTVPDIYLGAGTYWIALWINGYSTGYQAASGSTALQVSKNLLFPCHWADCSTYSCSMVPTPTPNPSCLSPSPGVAANQILLYADICP